MPTTDPQAAPSSPRGAHLVGSVPLADAEAVFRAAAGALGGPLKRIPDGETGVRSNWIGWQFHVMAANPQLELVPPDAPEQTARPRFRLRADADPSQLTFGNLGYADAAIASYATFAALQRAGEIPNGVRFLVSLPTPLAPVVGFVIPRDQPAVEPPYEARLLAELDQLCAAIPYEQLAVQWDIAVEFGVLEGVWQVAFSELEAGIVERIARISARVPDAVELGYHLCYGDAGHQHFVQPRDAARLVSIANAVAARATRPIQWLYLPVPRDRDDDAYYAPLAGLTLHPETELYLGLVHLTDGVPGAQRRMAAAQRAVPDFGVATECGFGRRPPETVAELLRIHADLLAPA
jgi:hypothetical protein